MPPKPHRRSTDAIQGNGYVTAQLMHQQEWREQAAAAAEQERVLREAGIDAGIHVALGLPALRLGARLGRLLVRLGTRLQGEAVPASDPIR